MQTSVSAIKQRDTSGFTLLEVLVVVTLLALFASLVLPLVSQRDAVDGLDGASERLSSSLSLLSENSVFRGQLLAMGLRPNGYTPLRYDIATNAFIPLTADQSFAAVDFDDNLVFEWQLDENRDGDVSLQQAMQAVVDSRSQSATSGSLPDEDEALPLPQLFFFPSGESTPVLLMLRDTETGEERKLQMDILGRVSDPDKQDDEDADEDAAS